MIQEGIHGLLAADSGVSALADARIYPMVLPKDCAFPCISYHDVSLSTEALMEGSGEQYRRVQIDCWAKTYAEAKQLQAAVMSVLGSFTGDLPDGTFIQNVVPDNQTDFYESDALLYRALTDFLFYL